MKFKHLYIYAAAFSLMASSCSVWESVKSTVSGNKEKPTTVSGAAATDITPSRKTDSKDAPQMDKTDRTMHPVVVLPSHVPADSATQAVAQPKEEVEAPKKHTNLEGVSRIVGGSWTITQVGDKEIDRDEDMPYIVFVPSEERFYANNGCNTLNGGYKVEGNKISFFNILTTLRLCPDVDFDHEINTIIAENADEMIKVSEGERETFLDFVTPSGKILMRLRRGSLEFLNGQWNITAVAGLETLNVPATVFFDLNDMKLHGNSGCNFFNGDIYLDHRMANAVDFSNIITTLRACEYPRQQTAILVGLEEATSVISDGSDKATLLDSNGTILMELQKAAQ